MTNLEKILPRFKEKIDYITAQLDTENPIELQRTYKFIRTFADQDVESKLPRRYSYLKTIKSELLIDFITTVLPKETHHYLLVERKGGLGLCSKSSFRAQLSKCQLNVEAKSVLNSQYAVTSIGVLASLQLQSNAEKDIQNYLANHNYSSIHEYLYTLLTNMHSWLEDSTAPITDYEFIQLVTPAKYLSYLCKDIENAALQDSLETQRAAENALTDFIPSTPILQPIDFTNRYRSDRTQSTDVLQYHNVATFQNGDYVFTYETETPNAIYRALFMYTHDTDQAPTAFNVVDKAQIDMQIRSGGISLLTTRRVVNSFGHIVNEVYKMLHPNSKVTPPGHFYDTIFNSINKVSSYYLSITSKDNNVVRNKRVYTASIVDAHELDEVPLDTAEAVESGGKYANKYVITEFFSDFLAELMRSTALSTSLLDAVSSNNIASILVVPLQEMRYRLYKAVSTAPDDDPEPITQFLSYEEFFKQNILFGPKSRKTKNFEYIEAGLSIITQDGSLLLSYEQVGKRGFNVTFKPLGRDELVKINETISRYTTQHSDAIPFDSTITALPQL